MNSICIFITCSYIPPSQNRNQLIYNEHMKLIESTLSLSQPGDALLVFGDFNLPDISWKFLSESFFYVPFKANEWMNEFLNKLHDLCVFQVNGVYNKFGKLLDLVFTNEPTDCSLIRSEPIVAPEDRYHPTLEINFNIPYYCSKKNSQNKKIFCFKKANYEELNNRLYNTDWLNLLSNSSDSPLTIDSTIHVFYNTLLNYIAECVPKITLHAKHGPPWNSKRLANLKNLKNKCFKRYKKSGLVNDYAKYVVSRANYNLLNTALYKTYINTMKNNFNCDPKSFYKFVNSKRKSTGYPNVMKYSDYESNDNLEISNLFADFFSTTYSDTPYNSKTYPYSIRENQPIHLLPVCTSQILSTIRNIKLSFGSGPDGIPSCVLKYCANALATPLEIVFNASIKHGYFPQFWKDSYIIPLFKSGNKSDITNYRGIAKLSAIPKLFEKCVMDNISHQMSSILCSNQHGFRKGFSTVTNILHLTTIVNNGFSNRQITDVIYTDFSKAFDKVNHNLLLLKLYLMGFSLNTLNWIKSYLSDRKQRVLFNDVTSKNISVKSGVPQGSHLGPILFSLFINDLPAVIKFSNVLMYADDLKIFLSYNDDSKRNDLQRDLDAFFEWCNNNLMILNLKKCYHMRFSRNFNADGLFSLGGQQLKLVNEFLDLGILLDHKLSFNKHITMMINKARGVLAFIKRWAKEFMDPVITKRLYTSLVRPILEYGSVVWDPFTDYQRRNIESVQKQFLLFCLGNTLWNPNINLSPYSTRLASIKLPTLESRRLMLNITFLIKLLNGSINSEYLLKNINFNVPPRATRNFIPLHLTFHQTNYANADPLRRLCKNYNDFYSFIDFHVNVGVIKRNIILYLNVFP